MEGESLLNDGTAVVLFGILFGAIVAEKLTVPKVSSSIPGSRRWSSLGVALDTWRAALPGSGRSQIEITLTTILAYAAICSRFTCTCQA